MSTLVVPATTRPFPARLHRYDSAEDGLRKEPSTQTDFNTAVSSASPLPTSSSPVPRPSCQLVTGSIPSLKALCINAALKGILSNQYTHLALNPELLGALAQKMSAKALFNDTNVALFGALNEIVLNNCHISDKGIRALFDANHNHKIVGLHLENTDITDASLRLIALKAPRLRLLDVSRCHQLTDKGIGAIAENCTELRYMGLRDIIHVSDAVVALFFRLPHLLRLDINGASRVTDSLAKRLQTSSKAPRKRHSSSQLIAPSLEELSLSRSLLTGPAITSVISFCCRLQSLNLNHCTNLSDNVLYDIIENAHHLEHLSLVGTPAITDASLPILEELDTLVLLENPQLSLPAIRKLVTSPTSSVSVYGADTEITLLRNSLNSTPFTITINEYETVNDLLSKINFVLSSESHLPEPVDLTSTYKLRRVTYRKNGTKRPGVAHQETEYGHLVRELVEKKHHIYLDQNPNSVIRMPGGVPQSNDLFLTLRIWDPVHNAPKDLRDVSLPSTMTLAELKTSLAQDGVLPCSPEKMFIVEEETDLRTNILATDAMAISMYGIISGDILHLEELTQDKCDASGQVIRSSIGDYLLSRPTRITIQETEESFLRRRKNLGFLGEMTYKFEVHIKSSWTFAKLKNRISRRTGIAAEYLKFSTRVEPQTHLQGNSRNIVDVLGGNLWLLLEIDSAEMMAEKISVVIHNFAKSGAHVGTQTLLVRKTATLKGLKEKIMESLGIPEDRQLLSRFSSKEVSKINNGKPLFIKQVYLDNSSKISNLGIHHIRLDQVDREVTENDLILQAVQWNGWKNTSFRTVTVPQGNVSILVLPEGARFNDVKAAISSASPSTMDMDNLTLKLAGSSTLQRDLMFDIKPRYFEENSSVVAATLFRQLDIVCWNEDSF